MWPTFSGYNTWVGNQSFSSVQSIEKYWNETYVQQKEKVYDVLNYMRGSYYLEGDASGIRIRGISSNAQDLSGAVPVSLMSLVVNVDTSIG